VPALLILIGTLFTWIALYQGILAYAVGPPPDRELVTIAGRVDDVDTPWTRNRFVEATQVKIEVAPVKFVTVAVRQETLATETLKALVGKTVTVRFAGGRPRNRWVYDLSTDGRSLIALDQERARDIAAHNCSSQLSLLNGAIAATFMFAALQAKRRRNSRGQDIDRIS
jgi:hypothetical protein